MSIQGEPLLPRPDPRPADTPWPEAVWPPEAGLSLAGRIVELTPMAPDDAAELFAALDDPRVWQYLVQPPPHHPSQLAEQVVSAWAIGWVPWTVRLLVDAGGYRAGSVVGWTSYLGVSARDARMEIGATGYAPDVWGTRVNPETKLLLLTHAFETLRMGRVQFKTDVRNERSQRALVKLGARYEGTLTRYQRRPDGTVRDTVLFSVSAEDWPSVKDGLQHRIAD